MILKSYEYAVLRYIHDQVTQETLNIGVILYSKEDSFLELKVAKTYGRLSETFAEFDGISYRNIVNQFTTKVARLGSSIFSGDWTTPPPESLDTLLPSILLTNDSSFIFGEVNPGIAPDLDKAMIALYSRLVTRYDKSDNDLGTRDDAAVWKIFATALSQKKVIDELQPKRIDTSTFGHEFDYAWKNERWHPLQPLSFDLKRPESIHRKANQWIGNLAILRNNHELGTVYFLIGKATSSSQDVQKAYDNALANMRNSLNDVRIYEETEADDFAVQLAREIAEHKV